LSEIKIEPQKQSFSAWAILVLISIFLAFSFQGTRGLWEPDEGRYSECAREMLISGDWTTPTINGELHFTKPPFTYWAIAIGLKIFGVNEWGARFYLALSFIITTILVALIADNLWKNNIHFNSHTHKAECSVSLDSRSSPIVVEDKFCKNDCKIGPLAGLIYCTMIVPLATANVVTTDVLLTMWETLAVFCFIKTCKISLQTAQHGIVSVLDSCFHRNDSKIRLWNIGMWCAFGLAFLTKGPPGLIPLLPMLIFVLYCRFKDGKKIKLFSLWGIFLFLIISFPWYLIVITIHKGLLDYFLKSEVVGRVVSGVHHRNVRWYKPFTIYGPMIIFGSFPWLWIWIFEVYKSKKGELFKTLKNRLNNNFILFLLFWIILHIILVSVSTSRLPLYVLPIFVPMAVLISRGILSNTIFYAKDSFSFLSRKPKTNNEKVTAAHVPLLLSIKTPCLWIITLIFLKMAAGYFPSPRDSRIVSKEIRQILGSRYNDNTEMVVIEKRYALPFYGFQNIALTTRDTTPDPAYVKEQYIEDKIKKIINSHQNKVFFVKKSRSKAISDLLAEYGIDSQIIDGPFHYALIVTSP